MSSRRTDARERILGTAYALFTTHGLSAVGVDRVVAEAGWPKNALYRHFRCDASLPDERLAPEVGEHCEHSTVVLWARVQVQLGEDARDMTLHRRD